LSGYSWLRDGLIPAEGALLEGLWIYAWLSFALAPALHLPARPFAVGWIVLLILLPAVFSRFMEYLLPWRYRLRTWLVAALVVLLFVLFIKLQGVPSRSFWDWRWLVDALFPWASLEGPARLGVLGLAWFTGMALAGRGLWLAASTIDDDFAVRGFLIGLAAFLSLFVVLLVALTDGPDQTRLGLLLGVYFCVSLSWLALVKRQTIETQAFTEASGRVGLSWLALLTTASLVIVAAAVLLANVAGSHALDRLGPIVLTVIVTVALLLIALARLLPRWLMGQPEAQDNSQLNQALEELARLNNGKHLPIPPHLLESLLAGAAVIALALLIVQIGRLRIRRAQRDEEHTSLWSWRLFLSQLRSLFRRPARPHIKQRDRRRATPARATTDTQLALDSPATSIRALYLAVLRWARQLGHPRHTARTASEFERELGHLLPPELANDLTGAYLEVRYGPSAGAPLDPALLAARWEAERAALAEGEASDP